MNSFRLFDRQTRLLVVAAGLLLATIVPVVVSVVVSAAQLTERSIALSSSSVLAEDVSYEVKFTSVGAAGAVVIDFCANSPIIGQACTPPNALNVAAATSATAGFTTVDDLAANTVMVTGTIAADTDITIVLDGIDNPSVAGPMYARILTYDLPTSAENYLPATPGTGRVDDGGAAVSITNTVAVSGAVLETMTFCVSAAAITADCTGVTTPVLALGETVGTTKALMPNVLSTGSLFTQISTNASSGAVISLKSNAIDCGGLVRAGSVPGTCDIEPALNDGVIANQARFGIRTAAPTTTGSNPVGTLQPVTGSGYNNTTYALNFAEGNATGVTSSFGDKFLDTDGAPANNQNMQLTFGASVNNNTPAGLYSADLSFIATGKF